MEVQPLVLLRKRAKKKKKRLALETEVSALTPEGNWLLPNSWQLTFWAMVECRKAKHTNQPLMSILLVFLKITFQFNKQGN